MDYTGSKFGKPTPKPKYAARRRKKVSLWEKVCEYVWSTRRHNCEDCGRDITRDAARFHHIVFKSQGGKDTAENTALLCTRCHNLRHGIVNGDKSGR